MTPPDAKERWAQRVLGGLGARPVGHAGPGDQVPQVPVTPPVPAATPAPVAPAAPPAPVQRGNNLPRWWEAKKPVVETGPQVPIADTDIPVEDDETKPDEDDDEQDADGVEGQEDDTDEEKPSPGGPVDKVATDSRGRATQRRTSVRSKAESAAGDRRLRIVAFNLSAAGVGYGFGLVQMIRAYMPVAEHAAVGIFGLVLAVAGAWVAWRVTGVGAVRAVFQEKTPLLRLAVSAGAAGIGHEVGPVPAAYLNQYGQEWGLGSSTISLLITAVGICGLLWWFIDRRIRHAHWLVRWTFRIPLASALVACIPYGSTPVV